MGLLILMLHQCCFPVFVCYNKSDIHGVYVAKKKRVHVLCMHVVGVGVGSGGGGGKIHCEGTLW